MDNFKEFSNVVMENAENIINEGTSKELEYKQIYSVHIPEPEKQILINKSIVHKIREECKKANKNKFPWAELFLAISTTLLGVFFGALTSGIPYEFQGLSIFFYSISPALAIGFFIAYLFSRNKENEDVKSLADKIEEYLLEIGEINKLEKEEKNEY